MRLIDADALIGKHEPRGDGIYVDVWDIEAAPTIEAEPVKHGRWDEKKRFVECSACGERRMITHNFCPNCGAKMDGGTENG